MPPRSPDRVPHVVVVGGGFAGLAFCKALRGAPVRITLVDRTNHHLFQPLLYQVATAGLSPAEIAAPIRAILRGREDVTVLLDEVTGVDLEHRTVQTTRTGPIPYDRLVLAAGARTTWFGHAAWETVAPGLKTLDDAVELRRRILLAFEEAEREGDAQSPSSQLTFVVIGGGPTGVEMAGAIAELSRFALARDFRHIDPSRARVVLVEAGPRLLPAMDPSLSEEAARALAELGVQVRLGTRVLDVREDSVETDAGTIPTRTVVWAAGVSASPLGQGLGVPCDRAGRVCVEPDLTLAGHPEVHVLGDMAHCRDTSGEPLPGIGPVALQQGRHAAADVMRELAGGSRTPFRYFDKGLMATIGRSRAVAQSGGARLSGWIAWMAWLLVHIWFLIGFRNRIAVLLEWFYAYVTFRRGARLITGPRATGTRV